MPEALANEFALDAYGYAAIIRLVELRALTDIRLTEKRRDEELKKEEALRGKEGTFVGVRLSWTQGKRAQLDQELVAKRRWLDAWLNVAWSALKRDQAPWSGIECHSLESLLAKYETPHARYVKRYLIMQEAVLTPLYAPLEGLPHVELKEINRRAGFELVAKACGFPPSSAEKLFSSTEAFFKEATGFWKRVIGYSVIGALAVLATAGLAAPAVATAVGATMGLHGAAAFTAGLAFFGGGAVAAGGLGMAGGLAVLVGGGAVLGAAGGAGLATLLQAPREAILVSMAKLVNYVGYLASLKGNAETEAIMKSIVNQFLAFKSKVETEVLCGDHTDKNADNALATIDLLDRTYRALYRSVRENRK